jgi:outer membrane protein
MKKFQLVLNIVLALAVIALFVLHFTGIGANKKLNSDDSLAFGIDANNEIFFVEIDTVISKFNLAKDLSAELESKYNSSDAALKSKQQAYEKDVNDYQYKAQRGLITRTEAADIEQTLYAKQQELVQLQQDLTNEINEKQSVMNRQVINAIMEYLKVNSSQFNYKYVLGASFGGNVLYANDSLDISASIIKGLNDKYEQDKKNK